MECGLFQDRNSETGDRKPGGAGNAVFPISHFPELRTPNSELRTPNSELRTPNSALPFNPKPKTQNPELPGNGNESYAFVSASGAATAAVRQLKMIVSTRKTKVNAIAAKAAGVGSRFRCTLRKTKTTAPATAVST